MNTDKINAQMEAYVQANEMAGGCLLVRRDGDVIFKGKWGWQTVETQTPVEYDTIFKLASLTKPVTAVAAMMLADRGQLALDDEISEFLPEFNGLRVSVDPRFAFGLEKLGERKTVLIRLGFSPQRIKTVPADRMITVRDLLSHSSGLEMGVVGTLAAMSMKGWRDDTLESRAKKWAMVPLDFQPGTATGYSPHAGLDVLARIIEVASGKSFAQFMQEELFCPLGMKDTTFHPTAAQQKQIQPLYKTVKGQHKNVSGSREDIESIGYIGPHYNSGAGGLYSTLEDFDRFGQMLANGGKLDGKRYLRPEAVALMGQEGACKHLQFAPGMAWGLGMAIRQDPEMAGSFAAKGTYGWSGAFGTHFFISPKDGLQVVFMMNRANIDGAGSYISRKVEELVWR